MVVCKFWQRGSCRNGDNCNFEHPPRQGTQHHGYQNQGQPARSGSTSNPFGQQTSDNSRNHVNNGFQRGGPAASTLPYTLDKKSIITDLKYERPQWILSAYGPGNKTTPTQLFGGPLREQSFEEMRLQHYMATAAGNRQQAINEVNTLWQQSEQQMQATIDNVDGAINYIINGEKTHPNRNEICEMSVGIEGGFKPDALRQGATATPFGGLSQSANTTAFGQPSQTSTGAFGQATQDTASAFGQPSQSTGPFGQPSALGQKPSPFGAPSFGAPSQPGGAFGQPTQPSTSPFGQPSQLTTGAFGQPSALGQSTPAFGTPAFGAPSQQGAGSFGQPSGLGQKLNPWGSADTTTANQLQTPQNKAFNQSSQAAATGFQSSQPSPFGQPSQPNAFRQPSGSSPFNQSSQPVVTSFPPSQPSAFGQPSQSNVFNQPPQPTTSQATQFGPTNTQSNTFGASSPAPNNPFAGTTQRTPINNGFPSSSQSAPTGVFGQPSNRNASFSSPFINPGAGTSDNPTTSSSGHIPIDPTPQVVNGNSVSKHYPPTEFPDPRPLTAYASITPDGLITMFKGKQVRYRGEAREPWIIENGTWSKKIWCPKGFPAANTETEVDASRYTTEIKAAYSHLRLDGEFQDGVMPMIPPRKEWSSYEF